MTGEQVSGLAALISTEACWRNLHRCCAGVLYGDVNQADIIKLHKASGKVTFLIYDDFENKPLPELQNRIKADLRSLWVEAFDHSREAQLLFYKGRFVSHWHERRAEIETFSAKLRTLSIPTEMAEGPKRAEFEQLRLRHQLNENLNPMRKGRAWNETLRK